MKPAPFDYLRAMTAQDALDALAQYGEDARVLAGGQSLMAVLNMRLAQPKVLVDISRTAELDAVRVDQQARHLVVNAAATQGSVEWRSTLTDEAPLLAMAFPHISHFRFAIAAPYADRSRMRTRARSCRWCLRRSAVT